MAADPDILERTYDEWIEMATASLAKMRAAGLFPQKVEIKVDDLEYWCRERGRPIDASARAAFTAECLRLRNIAPHRLGSGGV